MSNLVREYVTTQSLLVTIPDHKVVTERTSHYRMKASEGTFVQFQSCDKVVLYC